MPSSILENIVQIVQARTGNNTPGYQNIIKICIAGIFARIAEKYELYFLRSPDPEPISVAEGTRTYLVSEKVGRMFYISKTIGGTKAWYYKDWNQYLNYVCGLDAGDTEIGSVGVFTMMGIKAGKKQLLLDRIPNSSGIYYLHYQEKGDESNIDKIPMGWLKCMEHGVMSIIAPPEEVKRKAEDLAWWRSLTKEEDMLFEKELIKMVTALPAAPDRQDPDLDGLNYNRIQEINEL